MWQKGIQLAKEIYRITQTVPREEKFGLLSQMRRRASRVDPMVALRYE